MPHHVSFISEDLKHDTAFVYEVMSKVCEYLKRNYQHITKAKYFSDGCAVQYKNYNKDHTTTNFCQQKQFTNFVAKL